VGCLAIIAVLQPSLVLVAGSTNHSIVINGSGVGYNHCIVGMQSTIGERNLKSALIGIGVLYRVVSNESVIYLYGNGILLKGQTLGHLIVQNVVGGVTIGHVDGGLEVYGIANVAVVALTPRAGSVLNFLCHSGNTVLFLDGHFFCSGINGADRIAGQVRNHQIPAEGQVIEDYSARGCYFKVVSSEGSTLILNILTGSYCKCLNGSAIFFSGYSLFPSNNTVGVNS